MFIHGLHLLLQLFHLYWNRPKVTLYKLFLETLAINNDCGHNEIIVCAANLLIEKVISLYIDCSSF